MLGKVIDNVGKCFEICFSHFILSYHLFVLCRELGVLQFIILNMLNQIYYWTYHLERWCSVVHIFYKYLHPFMVPSNGNEIYFFVDMILKSKKYKIINFKEFLCWRFQNG